MNHVTRSQVEDMSSSLRARVNMLSHLHKQKKLSDEEFVPVVALQTALDELDFVIKKDQPQSGKTYHQSTKQVMSALLFRKNVLVLAPKGSGCAQELAKELFREVVSFATMTELPDTPPSQLIFDDLNDFCLKENVDRLDTIVRFLSVHSGELTHRAIFVMQDINAFERSVKDYCKRIDIRNLCEIVEWRCD